MSQAAMAWAMQRRRVTPVAKLVLLMLADSAGHDGEGLVVMRTLCALTELSHGEIADALAVLEGLGLLCRSKLGADASVAGNAHYRLACGSARASYDGRDG